MDLQVLGTEFRSHRDCIVLMSVELSVVRDMYLLHTTIY